MNIDHSKIEFVQNTITNVLKTAGISASVEYEHSLAGGLVFNLKSTDSKLLIGKQGLNLLALEHVVFAIVNKHFKEESESIRFSLDVGDYMRNRRWQLKQLIKEAVAELRQGRSELLLPVMSRYDRKFIHSYIQEQFPHLTTESIGEEPSRRIKISL